MYLATFVVLLVTLFATLRYWRFKNKYSSLQRKYKSGYSYPVVGHSFTFLNPETMIFKFQQLFNEFGNTVLIQLGFDYYLTTSCPKLVEFVCTNSCFNKKSVDYKFFANWFGTGLLTSDGEKWFNHRKILTQSFHYKILEEFVTVFNSASSELIKCLNKAKDLNRINIYDYVTLLTLDIIHDTAMGTSIKAQLNPDSKYVKSIRIMCDVIFNRIFSLFTRLDTTYNLTSLRQKEKAALEVIHGHAKLIIQRRKEALSQSASEEEESVSEIGIKKRNTFLNVLLKGRINGQPIPDEEIREEVDTFMFEGHDTTAVAISFILYALSDQPEIQDKIYEELESIFGANKERVATYTELNQMKYLEMAIKEGMRMYPSVPGIARHLTEDIEYDGMTLPKGLMMSLSIFTMHYRPDIYPDPYKFDPERFNLENSTKRHPFAYLPFSAGFRNCIGQKFAMLELKASISKILRNYELRPTEPRHEVKLVSKVTLNSSNGIYIRLIPRK